MKKLLFNIRSKNPVLFGGIVGICFATIIFALRWWGDYHSLPDFIMDTVAFLVFVPAVLLGWILDINSEALIVTYILLLISYFFVGMLIVAIYQSIRSGIRSAKNNK